MSFSLVRILCVLLHANDHANDPSGQDHLHHQRILKRMIGNERVQRVLLGTLVMALNGTGKNLSIDKLVAEDAVYLVFTLIKLTLSVPDVETASKAAIDGMTKVQYGSTLGVLKGMRNSRMFEFLVAAAGNMERSDDFMPLNKNILLLAEIFESIFSICPPESLNDNLPVESIFEDSSTSNSSRKPLRHSRFSGSLSVRLSTGEDYVISQNYIKRISKMCSGGSLNLDSLQRRRWKKPASSITGSHVKSFGMHELELLSQSARELIKSAFNPLLNNLADLMRREEDRSEIGSNLKTSTVSESKMMKLCSVYAKLGAWFLHYFCTASNSFNEEWSLVYGALDGDVLLIHARRLSILLNDYKNLMKPLFLTIQYFCAVFKASSMILASNTNAIRSLYDRLFFHMDSLKQIRNALKLKKLSKNFLQLLIETNARMLEELEKYCSGKRHVFVRKALKAKTTRQSESDDESSSERFGEKEFQYDKFVGEYCDETIVNTLLENIRLNCLTNSNLTIVSSRNFTAQLIKIISQDCRADVLFFRIPALTVFHQVLMAAKKSRMDNDVLVKITNQLVLNFLKIAQDDPMATIAIWFGPLAMRKTGKSLRSSEKPMFAFESVPQLCIFPDDWSLVRCLESVIDHLVESECSAVLFWLGNILSDVASERGNAENSESELKSTFCLRASNQSQKTALQDQHFCTLLSLLSFTPPNSNLPHWNIPVGMDGKKLEAISSKFQTILNARLHSEMLQPKAQNENFDSANSTKSSNYSVYDRTSKSANDSLIEDTSISSDEDHHTSPKRSTWSMLKKQNLFLRQLDFSD